MRVEQAPLLTARKSTILLVNMELLFPILQSLRFHIYLRFNTHLGIQLSGDSFSCPWQPIRKRARETCRESCMFLYV